MDADRRGHGDARGANAHDAEDHALVGRQVGSYEITGVLARGGMGLVLTGRDVRLGRRVAMKTLPSRESMTEAARARFLREARILATLSHPAIATVYGLEELDGQDLLIMELIDGITLAERIRGGPLPANESLHACSQIAEAVEAAHQAGVIHRDLKPSNIMCLSGARIKVLDFGLARPSEGSARPGTAGRTGIADITTSGIVVGTPGYMSPEQARGAALDERSDIFAWGCVLFECLTGTRAFPGDNMADALVVTLTREPAWDMLPGSASPAVTALLRRCLAKDVDARPRHMGELRSLLNHATDAPGDASSPDAFAPTVRVSPEQRAEGRVGPLALWKVAAVFLSGAMLAAAVVIALTRHAGTQPSAPPTAPTQTPAEPLRHLSIAYPGSRPQADLSRLYIAITRDGSRLAFTATNDAGEVVLWTRKLDEPSAVQVPDSADMRVPFFSPDGQWLAYREREKLMKRRLAGGQPFEIMPYSAVTGGVWSTDGTIIMTPNWQSIARVSEEGGAPEHLRQREPARGEAGYLLPAVSPDGKTILYTVWNGQEDTRIVLIDVASKRMETIVDSGANPRFAMTSRGLHLLWERKGTIYAARFDERTGKPARPEHVILDGILTDEADFVSRFDVSDEGTLVFLPGKTFEEEMVLSWIGLDGKLSRAVDGSKPFADVRLSADGAQLSVILKKRVFVVYTYDLVHGTSDRVTFGQDAVSASISPDGRQILYGRNAGKSVDFWSKNLRDGSDRLILAGNEQYPHQFSWSGDGRQVAFSRLDGDQSVPHLWVLTLDPPAERRVTDDPAPQQFPCFSPDGRWLAYSEGSEGTHQIHLRSFPDGRLKRQVSPPGSTEPNWSADGKTLYYRGGDKLYAVGISSDDGRTTGPPRVVYQGRFGQADGDLRNYAVAPDGRILIVEPSPEHTRVPQINVVLHWDRALP